TVNVNSTDLQWHPVYLIFGKLSIDSLQLKDVKITETRKEKKPVDLALPQLPRWFSIFRAWVNLLAIRGLTYTSPDSEPASLDAITASVLIDRGVLYLDRLNVKSGQADIAGTVILNLVNPGLRARLNAALHEKTAGLDNVFVNVDLPASSGKEQAAGPVLLKAFAGKKERLRFECHIGLERQAVSVKNAKLTKADNRGTLDANAAIDLSGDVPTFNISGKITKLDLAPEIPQDTVLSGEFRAAGNTKDFKGAFSLFNTGPSGKDVAVSGNIVGNSQIIQLQDLSAKIMDGTVLGSVEYVREFQTISTQIAGRAINPAKIERGLSGNINFRLNGRIEIPRDEPMKGFVKAVVYDSTFQKKPLTADLDAAFDNELIKINSLLVKGRGFVLNAHGTVQERVEWLVRIDDASKISPGTTGTLAAQGWARWRDNEAAGTLTARGSHIAWNTLRINSFNAGIRMPDGYDGPVAVDITANKVFYSMVRADTINLAVNGTTGDHKISFVSTCEKDRIEALAQGRYADDAWEGRLIKMSGREVLYGSWDLQGPSKIRVAPDGMSLSEFVIAGPGGEALNLKANLAFDPLLGFVDAQWRSVNLGRANKIVERGRLEGRTSGNSHVEWLKNDRLIIKSTIAGTAAYSQDEMKPLKADFSGQLNWDASGLNGALNIDLGNKGRLNAGILSKQSAGFSIPGKGTFHAEWLRLDAGMLQPVLGETVNLKGYLSGNIRGSLLPEKRFDLTGNTSLADGSFSWRSDKGEITAPIRGASLNMNWNNSSFKGNMGIAFGQFGNARADLTLPLPARFPLSMNTKGPLHVSANGEMNERGLITALFPGMAQETKGQLSFNMTATGTTADPRLNGRLNLQKAGAYVPPAGMELKDVNADITFSNDRITLSSLVARSGPGQISVTGTAVHSRGRISEFEALVKGDRFQVVNLPELNTLISPDIAIRGNTKKITVRGSVLIPEALIKETQRESLVKPSPDVIIAGQEGTHEKLPFALDLLVTVRMGEKVAVKAYGIDTRLAGAVDMAMTDPDNIKARGAINTVEGKFDAYGVKLNVRRGAVSFRGGPVKEATLDILAIRRIQDPDKGDVMAGVLVTGRLDRPVISLYAQPSMPEMDILSYIVLGRPGGPGGQGDTALLARAASGLLIGGKAPGIQKALGVDVDVKSQGNDASVSQSIVKIGKYLSPRLYVAFGRSIATGENTFSLRYRLTRKIEVESTVGNQTGGAIYYRVEFD
ncbi:MAG: protein of unknown function, DUF490-containing, partial [Deltaproteobacteria bacterium]|nr:protein of unknown function, DUF490-containing [Deltaproteobacteria bacterium]